MSTRRIVGIALLGLALGLGGCSGADEEAAAPRPVISVFAGGVAEEEEDEIARAREEAPEAPVVTGVAFEPSDPLGREALRAEVDLDGEWTSIRYEWRLNGEPFGANAAEVILPTLASGDEIRVRVTPYLGSLGGEAFEARQVVRNQKPHVANLLLERVEADGRLGNESEQWRVLAVVEDPDEDDVELEYRWFVNGEESELEEEVFPAGELARGDRLEVVVRAFDGRLWSTPARSGRIEIGNAPPEIVSTPPRPDESGYFSYAVQVVDPDDDDGLRFELKTAPRGMQIDERNGIVTWRPDPDQDGRHPVEVVVRDGRGGEASQSFSLALVRLSETETAAPPAAR